MSSYERFPVWSTHRNSERTHHEPVDRSLDRDEDPVAVLCHRSSTDGVTGLTRDAVLSNYRWAPPENSKSLSQSSRQLKSSSHVPPKRSSITDQTSHTKIKWKPPFPTSRNNKKRTYLEIQTPTSFISMQPPELSQFKKRTMTPLLLWTRNLHHFLEMQ